MANEKRMIYLEDVIAKIVDTPSSVADKVFDGQYGFVQNPSAILVDRQFEIIDRLEEVPTVDAVPVEQYKALLDMYHDLRENFIDYYCSGAQNVAPYCLNKCEECVDKWGYCKQYSDYCKGFNPAEVILDVEMDGE